MNFTAAINEVQLINELGNRDHHDRLQRIRLRDSSNPFELYNNDFRLRSRFSKESVFFVCDMARNSLQRPTKRRGAIPVELQVLTALCFYATDSFQQVIGDLNALSQPCISRLVANVSQVLAGFRREYIKMQTGAGARNSA